VGEGLSGELLSGASKIGLGLRMLSPFFPGVGVNLILKPGDRLLIQETEDGIYVTEHFTGVRGSRDGTNSYSYTGEIPQKFHRFIEAAGD